MWNIYQAADEFDATVTIADGTGATATADVDAEVAGIEATTAPIAATAGAGFSGEMADFGDSAPDAASQTYAATIDWGNGDTCAGTIASDGDGGYTVSGAHPFNAPVQFYVTVTITATDGRRSTTASTTADISGVAATGATIAGIQGQAFTGVVATFVSLTGDTPANSFNATIDWVDGTLVAATVTANANGEAGTGAAAAIPYAGRAISRPRHQHTHLQRLNQKQTVSNSTEATAADAIGSDQHLHRPNDGLRYEWNDVKCMPRFFLEAPCVGES